MPVMESSERNRGAAAVSALAGRRGDGLLGLHVRPRRFLPRQCGRKQRVEADQRAGSESGFRPTAAVEGFTACGEHTVCAAVRDACFSDSWSEVIASRGLVLQAARHAWGAAIGCGSEPGGAHGLLETDAGRGRVVEPAARGDCDRCAAGGHQHRLQLPETPFEVGAEAGLVDSAGPGTIAKADGILITGFSENWLDLAESRPNSWR